MLWHSEDVLICLSGELSAKFLNNNRELVKRKRKRERVRERKLQVERERERGRRKRERQRQREREPRGSAISRSQDMPNYSVSMRLPDVSPQIMLAGMVRLLDAIDKSRKCPPPLNRIVTNARRTSRLHKNVAASRRVVPINYSFVAADISGIS